MTVKANQNEPNHGQSDTPTRQSWMAGVQKTQVDKNVSANELTSLSALIAYVAHNSGENEFRVERRVADQFNIPNVKCLPSLQYDNAIRFLVGCLTTTAA